MATPLLTTRKLTSRPLYKDGKKVRETQTVTIPKRTLNEWADTEEVLVLPIGSQNGELGVVVLPKSGVLALSEPRLKKLQKEVTRLFDNAYEEVLHGLEKMSFKSNKRGKLAKEILHRNSKVSLKIADRQLKYAEPIIKRFEGMEKELDKSLSKKNTKK